MYRSPPKKYSSLEKEIMRVVQKIRVSKQLKKL